VEVAYMFVSALLGVGLLGFLLGPFSFRVKSRWCPRCGATTTAFAAVVREARAHGE
jgi:hypothetical protein